MQTARKWLVGGRTQCHLTFSSMLFLLCCIRHIFIWLPLISPSLLFSFLVPFIHSANIYHWVLRAGAWASATTKKLFPRSGGENNLEGKTNRNQYKITPVITEQRGVECKEGFCPCVSLCLACPPPLVGLWFTPSFHMDLCSCVTSSETPFQATGSRTALLSPYTAWFFS